MGIGFQIADMGLSNFVLKMYIYRDSPGDPVDKTPSSQCRGLGFGPWSGN